MFDIGWSELLVVAVVAMVVIGPRDLPAAMRTMGRALGAVRRMATDFRSQFDDAMREAELDDLRKEIAGLRDIARGIVQQNDVGALAQNELNQIQSSLEAKEAKLEEKEAEAHAEDGAVADEAEAPWPVADTDAIEAFGDEQPAEAVASALPPADQDVIEAPVAQSAEEELRRAVVPENGSEPALEAEDLADAEPALPEPTPEPAARPANGG